MATGTATPVTGTPPRTGMTGMTGMRPTQPTRPQGILARAMQWWGALKPNQRLLVWIGVGLLAVFIIGFVKIQQATAYVNLYENSLSPDDLGDVTQALAELHIPYNKTIDNHVMVQPSRRVEALASLTKQGIPRHPFFQLPSSQLGQTSQEFSVLQHEQLERDLTMVLRQFDEISDANVKLVIPDNKFWYEDQNTAKAAVVVKMKPGYDKLPLSEAKSIVQLIAYSVPDLKPENVQIVDTNGRLLTDVLKNAEDTSTADNMIEKKKQIQAQYESQAAQILDKVLGPDKYALAVNVDLNWDQQEKSQSVNGNHELNPQGTKLQEQQAESETYQKATNPSNGFTQIGYLNPPSDLARNGHYAKDKTLSKWAVDTQTTRTIVTPGQPVRLTATVLADQALSPATKRWLMVSVENAIGYNQDRGDRVIFGTLPFHREEIQQMSTEMNTPNLLRNNSLSAMGSAFGLRIALAALIFAVIFIGFYLYREQKARKEKSEPVLASGPTATVSDISDLLTDKTGKVLITPPNRVQHTERLEELVKEKPTRVAELLKTTWLSEK